ncbi:hypothetical protein GV791_26685 [Nocardia cyriacigeorgica]|uniref:Uncharacterized protein n=1 Tax=Nocardia cyriacigeorgica TaxID=135487 RepID=A0A6P1CXA4_9NOCA|nr:hypothetical protein [Nocardia cyriacigeorgica]MBF6425659.1 hypothetical protein [Nocardia cyriacigeorgica]NEW36124.1 hypothetical protein [Nocardia cyriacigeorgica]
MTEPDQKPDPRIHAMDPRQVGEEFRRRYCRPEVDIATLAGQLAPWNALLDTYADGTVPDNDDDRWLLECAFHITRWIQQELAQRSDNYRELARHSERVFHRIDVALRILGEAISTLISNSALEVKARETAAAEGFLVTPRGVITAAGQRRIAAGSDPVLLERRRAQLESILEHLARERDSVQYDTIARMRSQFGADGTGTPPMIMETQRLGADLVEPMRTMMSGMPESRLRSAMEQFIADAELAQRLIDDPESDVEAYPAIR